METNSLQGRKATCC